MMSGRRGVVSWLITHPDLYQFIITGKRKASSIAADLPHEKKRMREEDSEHADEEEPGN